MRAQATGRLVSLRVKLGDPVEPGPADRRDFSRRPARTRFSEAESKLEDLEEEDQRADAVRGAREGNARAGHGPREGGDEPGAR